MKTHPEAPSAGSLAVSNARSFSLSSNIKPIKFTSEKKKRTIKAPPHPPPPPPKSSSALIEGDKKRGVSEQKMASGGKTGLLKGFQRECLAGETPRWQMAVGGGLTQDGMHGGGVFGKHAKKKSEGTESKHGRASMSLN